MCQCQLLCIYHKGHIFVMWVMDSIVCQTYKANSIMVYFSLPVPFNPFTLRAAKTGFIILEIFFKPKENWKIFEGEMLTRSQISTLFQIFCEFSLYPQVIFKSVRVADETF